MIPHRFEMRYDIVGKNSNRVVPWMTLLCEGDSTHGSFFAQFRNTFPLVLIDCRRSSVLRCIEFQEGLPLQSCVLCVIVASLVG